MLKKVLMCRPIHYRVDYAINPWMQIGSVDLDRANQQWKELVSQYEELGVQVEIIEQQPHLPDMVFAADQGVLLAEKHILLSRFTYPERSGESEIYKTWYENHGYSVTTLPEGMNFEGNGELQQWRNLLFIGTGFRTDVLGAQTVGKLCNKQVIPIELVDSSFYHLDTCVFVLDDSTIFYYPPALSNTSISQLQSLVPNLVPLNDHDTANFAANSVVVGNTVLLQTGSEDMPEQVSDLGYEVVEIDVREFMKAGGGAHCLTGTL